MPMQLFGRRLSASRGKLHPFPRSTVEGTRKTAMETSNTLQKLRKFLEGRTGKAIGDYNMIEDGDTTLVCVSGGKL